VNGLPDSAERFEGNLGSSKPLMQAKTTFWQSQQHCKQWRNWSQEDTPMFNWLGDDRSNRPRHPNSKWLNKPAHYQWLCGRARHISRVTMRQIQSCGNLQLLSQRRYGWLARLLYSCGTTKKYEKAMERQALGSRQHGLDPVLWTQAEAEQNSSLQDYVISETHRRQDQRRRSGQTLDLIPPLLQGTCDSIQGTR
jgi:hypothetical protein